VNVRKSPLWNWNRLRLQMNVLVNFSSLAAHAAAGGCGNVPPHVGPAKGGGHQACGRFDPWMVHFVDGTNDRGAKCRRYERPENTGGNVTQEVHTIDKPVNDLNGWRGSHGDNVRTLALRGCHGGKIDSDIGGGGIARRRR
jgi:hypothetical protein